MVPGLVLIVDGVSTETRAQLEKMGVQIIESQTWASEDSASWLQDVQAKQVRKGHGKEARTPWFRQFEKRGRYGR